MGFPFLTSCFGAFIKVGKIPAGTDGWLRDCELMTAVSFRVHDSDDRLPLNEQATETRELARRVPSRIGRGERIRDLI